MRSTKSKSTSSRQKKQSRSNNRTASIVVDDGFAAHLAKLSKLLRLQQPLENAIAMAVAPPPSSGPQTAPLSTPATSLARSGQEPKLWEAIDALRASIAKDDKYIDFASSFVLASGGTVIDIPGITQGIGFSQRTGDYIRLRKYVMKYEIQYNLAAGAPLGVLVVLGKARDGVPAANAVFSQVGAVQANSLSFPVRASEFDLKWLKFNHHDVSSAFPYIKGELAINPDWMVQFSAGTSTIIDGDLFTAVICDVVAGTNPTFRYSMRVEYTDADD